MNKKFLLGLISLLLMVVVMVACSEKEPEEVTKPPKESDEQVDNQENEGKEENPLPEQEEDMEDELVALYKEEGKRLVTNLNLFYSAETEEEIYALVEDTFHNPDNFVAEMTEMFEGDNNHKDLVVDVSNEKVTGQVDNSYVYESVVKVTATDIDGNNVTLEDNTKFTLYVKATEDDKYLVTRVEATAAN